IPAPDGAPVREFRALVRFALENPLAMFESLTSRLGEVFDRLRKRGALTEADVNEAMREVRIALLEADVALPVVKSFVDSVRARAVGQQVLKSVTPGQMA